MDEATKRATFIITVILNWEQ